VEAAQKMRDSRIRPSRRAAPKQDEIITEFRRQIVNGLLKPGSRLPPRRQIEARFQAGVVTVQRAMDHLIRDGFILTQSTAGTYVVPHPPHLSRYGLVFMSRPAGWHRWTRFWTTLSEQAEDIEQTTPLRMPRYYMEGSLRGEDYEVLLEDAGSDRLA